MQNSKEAKINRTSWFEIPVLNFDRAKNFYEKLFEIKIEALDFGPL
jgi:predicted enzyme related to lactoylglutathione lyase